MNGGFFATADADGYQGAPSGIAVYNGHLEAMSTGRRAALVIGDGPIHVAQLTSTVTASIAGAGHPIQGINRLGQAAEILGQAEDDLLVQDLHLQSRGNPLYLLALAQGDGRATGTPVEQPPGADKHAPLAEVLSGEMAALNEIESAVAGAAALLDGELDLEQIAIVANRSAEGTATGIAALVRRDLMRFDDDGPFFRHPLLRGFIYTDVDPLCESVPTAARWTCCAVMGPRPRSRRRISSGR